MSDIKTIGDVIRDFEQQLQKAIGGKVSIMWVPDKITNDLETLKLIILNVTTIDWNEIIGGNRRRHIVRARQLFCWFAHHRFGRGKSELMRIMGIDHTTVIHSIKTVNDLLETGDVLMTDDFFKISKQLIKYEESKINTESPAVASAGQ